MIILGSIVSAVLVVTTVLVIKCGFPWCPTHGERSCSDAGVTGIDVRHQSGECVSDHASSSLAKAGRTDGGVLV